MTTTTTNEAAERLREAMQLRHGDDSPCFDVERLDKALDAEYHRGRSDENNRNVERFRLSEIAIRRATVERMVELAGGYIEEGMHAIDAYMKAARAILAAIQEQEQ